jgi:hypothetical protein
MGPRRRVKPSPCEAEEVERFILHGKLYFLGLLLDSKGCVHITSILSLNMFQLHVPVPPLIVISIILLSAKFII